MNKNLIFFLNNKICKTELSEHNQSAFAEAITVHAELMRLGYMFSQDAWDFFTKLSKKQIVNFYNDVMSYVIQQKSADKAYGPLYRNFPNDVMEMSKSEYFVNQIIHYYSCGSFIPATDHREFAIVYENSIYTTIELANSDFYTEILLNLINSVQSLSPRDSEILDYYITNEESLIQDIVKRDEVKFKEIACKLFCTGITSPKTVTDVLRMAVYMSGGDISLPAVPPSLVKCNSWTSVKVCNEKRKLFKFRKFSRKERRTILSQLEASNLDASEAVLKKERWLRLGEILHPAEASNAKRFPKSAKFFGTIRNTKIDSWYATLNKCANLQEHLMLLQSRPGEFARRLDFLIRKYGEDNTNLILGRFRSVVDKVSNKVLFELIEHFSKRTEPCPRKIKIKGSRKEVNLKELPVLSPNTIGNVFNVCKDALIDKFTQSNVDVKELFSKKVFISEVLKNISLPKDMRSVSGGTNIISRGSRIPLMLPDSDVIRIFCHWNDADGTEDIDLSINFYSDSFHKKHSCSWNTDMISSNGLYYHSGDVRFVRGPCAEYIDVHLDKIRSEDTRYAVISVDDFTGKGICKVPDTCIGFMERSELGSKDSVIFKPNTVNNCVKLNSDSSSVLVGILDLYTKEYINIDSDLRGIPVSTSNLFELNIKDLVEPPKFSLFDLLSLHCRANNTTLVDEPKNAEVVFNVSEFRDYQNILKFMS